MPLSLPPPPPLSTYHHQTYATSSSNLFSEAWCNVRIRLTLQIGRRNRGPRCLVCTVTRLRSGWSIPGRLKRFFSPNTCLDRFCSASCSLGTGSSFFEGKATGAGCSPLNLRLVRRLRISGAVVQLSPMPSWHAREQFSLLYLYSALVLRDLAFSQWWLWSIPCSAMFCCVVCWKLTEVS